MTTRSFGGEPGQSYYLKPVPIVELPWNGDVLVAVEVGVTLGIFQATGLKRGTDYVVYHRMGEVPASTDDMEGIIRGVASAIQAKTDLIGTGSAISSAPVTATGKLNPIVQGDDYLSVNDRAFEWLVDPVAGFAIDDCSCWFGGTSCGSPDQSWLAEGALTEEDDRWRLAFELVAEATADLELGHYNWSVSVRGADGTDVTRVRNKETQRVELVAKHT